MSHGARIISKHLVYKLCITYKVVIWGEPRDIRRPFSLAAATRETQDELDRLRKGMAEHIAECDQAVKGRATHIKR